ncbi:hypothetical protein CY35_10G097100 [Sphagnum magellanicum]|nr:hypothetical protein CY35_10G097100 [Sphagnum magellanicum]
MVADPSAPSLGLPAPTSRDGFLELTSKASRQLSTQASSSHPSRHLSAASAGSFLHPKEISEGRSLLLLQHVPTRLLRGLLLNQPHQQLGTESCISISSRSGAAQSTTSTIRHRKLHYHLFMVR